eukprot:4238889-Amphidinium_carterae.1
MTATDKGRFFRQWELHREEKDPLKWATAFASSVTEERVSSTDFRKKYLNARQILKEFGQEHLVGVPALKMVKDILYQQSVKHHYENETRVSASENRDLDEHYIILDD